MAVNYNQLRIDTPETRAALEQEYANSPRPTVRSQRSGFNPRDREPLPPYVRPAQPNQARTGQRLGSPTQTIDGAFGGMLPSVPIPASAPIDYSQGNFGGYSTIMPMVPVGDGSAGMVRATGFDTTLPTQAPTGSTVFNPVAPPSGSVPSGGNVGAVTGGAVLSGLLTGNLGDALRGAGEYYLGQEGVEGAYQTGVTGLEMAQQLGQQAAEAAEFKPYTVTSNLARVGTDPSGGFTTQLSPEQQALQNQIMGQAGGFFSQLQADPAAVQADIYESIRATQRPEEERQRLALE